VGGQHHALAALPLGKTWYPLYRRLGGPQGWSGHVQKILSPLGFDPQTVQPIVSRYTDCELPGPHSKTLPTLNKVIVKCTVHCIVHL
jgi:hypothetical protein